MSESPAASATKVSVGDDRQASARSAIGERLASLAFYRLLLWLFAVGMAGDVPFGPGAPDGLRGSSLTESYVSTVSPELISAGLCPATPDDDDDSGFAGGPPDTCDENSARFGPIVLDYSFPADDFAGGTDSAPARHATERATARAPPSPVHA